MSLRFLQGVAPSGFALDDVGQAPVVRHVQAGVDAGPAQVCVDQQRLFPLQAVGNRQVDCRGGLPLARCRRRDEQAARPAAHVGQQDGIAQRADGFFECRDLFGTTGRFDQLAGGPLGVTAAIHKRRQTAAPLLHYGERPQDFGL